MSLLKTYNVNTGNIAALLANQKDNFDGIIGSMNALRTGQNNIDLRNEIANLNMDELTQGQVMALNTGQDLNEQSLGDLSRLNERANLNRIDKNKIINRDENRIYQAELLKAEIANRDRINNIKNEFTTSERLAEIKDKKIAVNKKNSFTTLKDSIANENKKSAAKILADAKFKSETKNRKAYGSKNEKNKEKESYNLASIESGIQKATNALLVAEQMPISTPEERKLKVDFMNNANFAKNSYTQQKLEFMKQIGTNSASISKLIEGIGGGSNKLNKKSTKTFKIPNTPTFRNAQRMQGFEDAWNDGVILETKGGLMIGNEKLTQGTLLRYLMSR